VIWDQGTIHTLGTLGGSRSGAVAINNAGQLIGVAQTPDGIDHPVIWDGGTIHDLATVIPADSGWQLRAAAGINNSGQIVGWGVVNGYQDAYLLTPTGNTEAAISARARTAARVVSKHAARTPARGHQRPANLVPWVSTHR
jgi:probable HAF family extracellular repeat protein